MVAPPKIDIYYSKICDLCSEAIDFFHKHGTTFTAIAIEYDSHSNMFIDSDHTREMYRRCGEEVEFVPQIFIGKHHVGGWRKMETLIRSGKLEQLLAESRT